MILHLGHRERNPILDVYATWYVGSDEPLRFDFNLWTQYVTCCRELATNANVPMRTLDRALFKFGEQHRPRA